MSIKKFRKKGVEKGKVSRDNAFQVIDLVREGEQNNPPRRFLSRVVNSKEQGESEMKKTFCGGSIDDIKWCLPIMSIEKFVEIAIM